jgi:predicted esterase
VFYAMGLRGTVVALLLAVLIYYAVKYPDIGLKVDDNPSFFMVRCFCWSGIISGLLVFCVTFDDDDPPLTMVSATDPHAADTLTVFFPGNSGDITQLALYVGPTGFVLPREGGQHVYHRNAAGVFPKEQTLWLGRAPTGEDVLPHGLAYYYRNPMGGECHVSMSPLVRGFFTGVRGGPDVVHHLTRYNFGQHDDVTHGLRVIRAAMAAHPTKRVILFGASRGAAVALQVAARLTNEEAARVRLVVLEGCFTDVPRVLNYRFTSLLGPVVNTLLSWVTAYNPEDQATPLRAAQALSHAFPVALVASHADRVVPHAMTTELYEALPSGQRKHVLMLNRSAHSDYATGNEEDRAAYVAFMSDLYAQYQ